jgi:hypothetical protein
MYLVLELNQVQLENWSLPVRKTTVLDLDKVSLYEVGVFQQNHRSLRKVAQNSDF